MIISVSDGSGFGGADGSEGSAMSHAAHMLYVAGNLPEEDISHS